MGGGAFFLLGRPGHTLGLQLHFCHHNSGGSMEMKEQKQWADSNGKKKKINRGKIVSKLNVFPYFQCGVCSAPK